MDRYTLICRLRAPAYILLTGVIAIMAEWTSVGWGKSWPLYLVLEGVLQLAQRWALSSSNPAPTYPFGGVYGGGTGPGGPESSTVVPAATTAIVPAPGVTPEVPGPPSTEWRS